MHIISHLMLNNRVFYIKSLVLYESLVNLSLGKNDFHSRGRDTNNSSFIPIATPKEKKGKFTSFTISVRNLLCIWTLLEYM